MRDYGVVSPRFWTGSTGKALRGDPEAQLLAMYLMTSPHANMIGIYHCPILYIAHETGLGMEGASKALQRLIEGAFCAYDEASETVFVHRMAAFQIADTLKPADKRVAGVVKQLREVPVFRFIEGFHARFCRAFNLPEMDEIVSPLEGASKPLRSQEQEQEQEQDQEKQSPIGDSSAAADAAAGPPDDEQGEQDHGMPPCPHEAIIALYHRELPMLARVRDWTPKRAKSLRARWREKPKRQELAWWERYFRYVAKSDFLTGRAPTDGRAWQADLEWLVQSSNLVKVVEGKYENREAA